MSNKLKQPKENKFLIFTASSFDPRLKIGAGCNLVLTSKECKTLKNDDLETLPLSTIDFKEITATRLELETMIWAIETFHNESSSPKLTVYSGFKTSKDLLQRRAKLERTNYSGAREGTTLANADLYKKLFKLHDRLSFEMIWMEEPASDTDKTSTQFIFSKVCEHVDQALKNQLKEQNPIADKWF